MRIKQIFLYMTLSIMLGSCTGEDRDDITEPPVVDPPELVPGDLDLVSVTPRNNQECTFSRIVGNQAEVDFLWQPAITNAVNYRATVNDVEVYSGSEPRFSALVDFSTRGTWKVTATSIDGVTATSPELSFVVPARPVVNAAPQPVDYETIRYNEDTGLLIWDAIVDPDGDAITYSFLINVDGQRVNDFPGLENAVATNSISVFLPTGSQYEIIIITSDGLFQRFSTPFQRTK